jgi:integration host factor subunit beta
MNKIELIQALKDLNGLSKTEAEKVVNLFFMEMTAALAKGKGSKFEGSVPFSSRNMVVIPGGTPKLVNG